MSLIGEIVNKIFKINPPPQAANAAAASPPPADANKPSAAPVDVNQVLTEMSKKQSEKLNWQSSIVDLMKLLNLDSSLSSRQQLAKELNYTEDTKDSAAMNIWLHQQVIKKLQANGGRVSADLIH